MGFILNTDIFGPAAVQKSWFRDFPIQATILFRPSDHRFALALLDQLRELDRLTGSRIVFFTVLDPPHALHWNREIRAHHLDERVDSTYTHTGLTLENSVLMYELARRFGVSWDLLPVLIASPNLWDGEFVRIGTDVDLLEPQLRALAELADLRPLRAGVEMLGKLRSLARDDFAEAQERLGKEAMPEGRAKEGTSDIEQSAYVEVARSELESERSKLQIFRQATRDAIQRLEEASSYLDMAALTFESGLWDVHGVERPAAWAEGHEDRASRRRRTRLASCARPSRPFAKKPAGLRTRLS